METDPFKLNQRRRWQNQISKSKAARSNQQLPTRCISGNCYALVTKCVRDVQNMRNFSNNRHVTMLYSFLRWRRFNTSTFQCVKKVYAAHISVSFTLPPLIFRSSGRLLKAVRESWVQGLKAQCTRIWSKYTVFTAPRNVSQAHRKCILFLSAQNGVSKLNKQLPIFRCKGTDMAALSFLYRKNSCVYIFCLLQRY